MNISPRKKSIAIGLAYCIGSSLAAPAVAEPISTWDFVGPGETAISGTLLAPSFQYAHASVFSTGSWTASATALRDGVVTLHYDYSGFHSFAGVVVFLNSINPAGVLVNDGPVSCCTPPSGGFSYTGVQTVVVSAGDTIGYTFGGSNSDSARLLEGVLDLLISFQMLGPSAGEELGELLSASGGAARLVVVDAAGVARDFGQISIATRNGTPEIVRVTTPEGGVQVVAASQGGPGMMGNLYTWAQVTGFRSTERDGPASVGGGGLQIGADIEIGADMVAGLSLGYSQIDAEDGGFGQDGELVYLQPYFAYSAGDWHGNASLIYGRGQYDQTSLGGDGTGETELLAFTFEGGYDIAVQNALVVTPTIGLIHGREIVEGTGGTLAAAGSETYRFTQASLGGRVQHDMAAGSVFAGLHADYLTQDAGAVLTRELLSDDGWTGRIEFGGSTELSTGLGLSTSVEVGGLGGDLRTVSGGLRVAFSF